MDVKMVRLLAVTTLLLAALGGTAVARPTDNGSQNPTANPQTAHYNTQVHKNFRDSYYYSKGNLEHIRLGLLPTEETYVDLVTSGEPRHFSGRILNGSVMLRHADTLFAGSAAGQAETATLLGVLSHGQIYVIAVGPGQTPAMRMMQAVSNPIPSTKSMEGTSTEEMRELSAGLDLTQDTTLGDWRNLEVDIEGDVTVQHGVPVLQIRSITDSDGRDLMEQMPSSEEQTESQMEKEREAQSEGMTEPSSEKRSEDKAGTEKSGE